MSTFQQVIDDARVTLNDEDAVRYTTPQLMSYCNDGIQEMYRIRPDFLFGNYTAATVTYVESDNLPLTAQYQNLLHLYVVFRAELRDDEYSAESRAGAMRSLFRGELT